MYSWQDLDLNQPINWAHPLNRGRVAWWLAIPGRYGAPTWRDLVKGQPGTLSGFASGYGWSTKSYPGGAGSIRYAGPTSVSDNGSVQTPFTNLSYTSGTICWWQFPTVAYNSGTIRGMWGQVANPASNGEFSAQVYSDNNWYVGWRTSTTDYRVSVPASATNFASNQWTFYAFTWNSSASNSTLYMNAASVVGTHSGLATVNIGQSFYLGGQDFGTSFNNFPGWATDFQIFNRALAASEIAAIYYLSRQGYPDVLNRNAFHLGALHLVSTGIVFRRTLSGLGARVGTRQHDARSILLV